VRLEGRVALVTGAGRGIGRAVAEAMAAAGARVFLCARTEAELADAAARIRGEGGAAAFAPADVSSAADVDAAVDACESAFGPADILVNAAGAYGPIGPTWEIDADAWWRAHEVNVRGTLLTCRAVLPAMIAAGAGRIINFSGGGATAPLPRFSAYASSKAAVVRLTETLAEEVRAYGVTVNAIAPGAVDTRLQDEVLAAGARAGELYERTRRLRQTGEGGVSAELPAALAVFLASDAAAELTGKLISAPHDGWKSWDAERMAELGGSAWLTIRRLDPYTIRPLLASLPGADA
jgi:NAD(P)-dependent dehydrogenase (short-subunit alcohol dehydrogenase family)